MTVLGNAIRKPPTDPCTCFDDGWNIEVDPWCTWHGENTNSLTMLRGALVQKASAVPTVKEVQELLLSFRCALICVQCGEDIV